MAENGSTSPTAGAIDCDIHPAVPSMAALLPYMTDHWRDSVQQRGVHELSSIAYPKNAPITARPDWRETGGGPAGSTLEAVRTHALDGFGSSLAICNCLYGVQLLFSEDMAAGFATAVNTWMAREWLDAEPRLRASIVVPPQSPDRAVDEIQRWAGDPRFVSVLMLVMDEMPLGRRHYWPIYKAAERHDLPITIHAGSAYRHPVTPVGWPSYFVEDYAAQSQAFQTTLTSLIAEGVFVECPRLKVVLAESGVAWFAAHLWRLTKFWRGLRQEIPWVEKSPLEIAREHVRLTLQPFDAPPTADQVERLLEHIGSDEVLLFSTDYPHWQFDGADVLPDGLPDALRAKIMVENPTNTFPRLKEVSS